MSEHHSADNGCEAGSRIENEVDEADPHTTLMDKVEVSYGCNDERLESGSRKALNDACGKEVIVTDLGFSDCCSDDVEEC